MRGLEGRVQRLETGKPFAITGVQGNFVNIGYPLTLTASVPSGPMSFTYVVNGKSYTLTGTGTVTAYYRMRGSALLHRQSDLFNGRKRDEVPLVLTPWNRPIA